MILRNTNSLGLYGYLIVINEEIHSRQIKLLDHEIKQL